MPAPTTQAQSQPDALGSVSGTILNARGDPVAGVVVWLAQYKDFYAPRSITSGAQGDYHFASADQSRALTVSVEAGEVTEGIDMTFGHPFAANLPYIRGGDGATD